MTGSAIRYFHLLLGFDTVSVAIFLNGTLH